MLRIVQNTHAAGAKSYYSSADYYTEGQEQAGSWHGKGAERLGLTGTVKQQDWDALCDNRNPETGATLTQRQKETRRVGYDFNFHVPKSVSILYSLTRDERILDAFRDSVRSTMNDIESESQTRVRSGGRNEDRSTGNLVWGEFIHFTARPVDGVPDPHLHAHCFVFNTTFDAAENRWKACQFAGIKRDGPYFEALFHARLGEKLSQLGLSIERSRKGWEIAGIPTTAVRKFSRRTTLIEQRAREEGLTNPDAKGELGAKTRQRKAKDLTLPELESLWRASLTPEEHVAVDAVATQIGGGGTEGNSGAKREAVDHAISHCFEQKSVMPERMLMAEALKHSVGRAAPESVIQEFGRRPLLSAAYEGRKFVTTPEVLDEEQQMIRFARDGRGTCRPMVEGTHRFKRDWLNTGQKRAVKHVLESPDRVMVIRGAAGTGKTTMMQEAVEAIESNGQRVLVFAPSANASRGVLRDEGFSDANTVARLLVDKELQSTVRGQVIWIDEAGLLGARTMGQLFDLAKESGARVILSGDRRQHGSVQRGAALRVLEDEAGIVPAEIKEIQRQRGDYKRAVEALSEGRVADGFQQLDRLGWIREVDHGERYKQLAEDYASTVAEGRTALVVSPTHLEGERITREIRRRLKESGKLGGDEREFRVLRNANLTEAERADAANYVSGDVIEFHQNARGFKRGQRVEVGTGLPPVDQAQRFQVFHSGTLSLAKGEIIRMTQNGKTADGKHRLNNGAVFTVKRFTDSGDIVLNNNWIMDKEWGHWTHGYVVTSHASQGRTVDCVFIGQSAESWPASSREQFYVSVSRGRQQAVVFTNDKRELLDAVSRSDDRLSASELMDDTRKRNPLHLLSRHRQASEVRLPVLPRVPEPERLVHER